MDVVSPFWLSSNGTRMIVMITNWLHYKSLFNRPCSTLRKNPLETTEAGSFISWMLYHCARNLKAPLRPQNICLLASSLTFVRYSWRNVSPCMLAVWCRNPQTGFTMGLNIYFTCSTCAKYCDECVCPSVHSHVSKTTRISHNVLYMLPVAGRGSVLPLHCDILCSSSFIDDI